MNKRILLFVLSLMMVLLLLCACNDATSEEKTQNSITEPSATDTVEPDSTANVSTDAPAQSDKPETAIGWIDAGMARFYVPEKFVESDYEGHAKAPGMRSYSYTRSDLNMSIDVACLTAPEINIGEKWFEDSYDYYSQTDGITYNTSSENSFTVSGLSGDNVYYIREVKIGDQGIEVSINYPAANKAECDRILEDFMKNLSC